MDNLDIIQQAILDRAAAEKAFKHADAKTKASLIHDHFPFAQNNCGRICAAAAVNVKILLRK